MKPTIIAIVGASGSGKTFMTRFLQNKLNIPVIVSHTTRPPRKGEIHGKDYFFIESTTGFSPDQMLTRTCFGGYDYFSLLDQLPTDGLCTYVVEETGLEELIANSNGRYDVYAVSVFSSAYNRSLRGVLHGRIARDRQRKELPRLLFDAFVVNDGTKDEFERKILTETKIMELWERRK